jgi:hypothetical protein
MPLWQNENLCPKSRGSRLLCESPSRTNGFSKKVENHVYQLALHYMHYKFCRIHKLLRATPAMAAGVTDHVWETEEIIALMN